MSAEQSLRSSLTAAMGVAETAFDLRDFMAAPNGEDDDGGLSGCPCFRIRVEGLEADGHCWRVSCTPDHLDEEGRCCVHVRGDRAIGERLKELLDAMDWYGKWHLHFGDDCR